MRELHLDVEFTGVEAVELVNAALHTHSQGRKGEYRNELHLSRPACLLWIPELPLHMDLVAFVVVPNEFVVDLTLVMLVSHHSIG